MQIQQPRREPCLVVWGFAGLSSNHHWAWPRRLPPVTAAPSYKKAAAVLLGDFLKHLGFCQSFPTRVGEGFCVSPAWLCSSACPWQEWFPFCSAMEEPKAVLWQWVHQNVKIGCVQIVPSSHLPVGNYSWWTTFMWGELALTFKSPCENYTVYKKHVTCSFTSESQVPQIHQSTIRNKRFREEFNSVANNSNKTDIPELAGITYQLWHKMFIIRQRRTMDICKETRFYSCGS